MNQFRRMIIIVIIVITVIVTMSTYRIIVFLSIKFKGDNGGTLGWIYIFCLYVSRAFSKQHKCGISFIFVQN